MYDTAQHEYVSYLRGHLHFIAVYARTFLDIVLHVICVFAALMQRRKEMFSFLCDHMRTHKDHKILAAL
ncbi:hypothetical protein MPTK2_3g10860 [Marchantia polymorpha subsp. ruderalis]